MSKHTKHNRTYFGSNAKPIQMNEEVVDNVYTGEESKGEKDMTNVFDNEDVINAEQEQFIIVKTFEILSKFLTDPDEALKDLEDLKNMRDNYTEEEKATIKELEAKLHEIKDELKGNHECDDALKNFMGNKFKAALKEGFEELGIVFGKNLNEGKEMSKVEQVKTKVEKAKEESKPKAKDMIAKESNDISWIPTIVAGGTALVTAGFDIITGDCTKGRVIGSLLGAGVAAGLQQLVQRTVTSDYSDITNSAIGAGIGVGCGIGTRFAISTICGSEVEAIETTPESYEV